MPLPKGTTREDIIESIPSRIENYNRNTRNTSYNRSYLRFITEREKGIKSFGGLTKWLASQDAVNSIYMLMQQFGMQARASVLTEPKVFARKLFELTLKVDVDGLSSFTPDQGPLTTKLGNSTVAQELGKLFDFCSKWGHFSEAGGIVIGSKVAHAILPELCPMIDTSHIGISLYNVASGEYLPPGDSWDEYLGYTPEGKYNPSPRGDGRKSWKRDQFLCAIGLYARIYHDRQEANGCPGVTAFLALDPVEGTTGIPRLLDKVFW